MDSWKRFDEESLPPIESFYSKLTGTSISEEDYQHAQKVWRVFECKTLGNRRLSKTEFIQHFIDYHVPNFTDDEVLI